MNQLNPLSPNSPRATVSRRVVVLGATGTAGRAAVRALVGRGHEVVCIVRSPVGNGGCQAAHQNATTLGGATARICDVTRPLSLVEDGFRGEHFDCLVSCLASRTGLPADAWAIDYKAHLNALAAAQQAGVSHVVLLSAICVQKPMLEFQRAKLAFEAALTSSGLTYSIVRPTAFFKSLSGQVDRLRRGRPFLLFGDGRLTACKAISDDDLGTYIAECIDDELRFNRILPIGGPGGAVTPREQGEKLFELLGHKPKFTHVPVALIDAIGRSLAFASPLSRRLAEKAELARIGRYYATESMLVLNPATGLYDEAATPSTGTETLFDFYERLIRTGASVPRGDHAVF